MCFIAEFYLELHVTALPLPFIVSSLDDTLSLVELVSEALIPQLLSACCVPPLGAGEDNENVGFLLGLEGGRLVRLVNGCFLYHVRNAINEPKSAYHLLGPEDWTPQDQSGLTRTRTTGQYCVKTLLCFN